MISPEFTESFRRNIILGGVSGTVYMYMCTNKSSGVCDKIQYMI